MNKSDVDANQRQAYSFQFLARRRDNTALCCVDNWKLYHGRKATVCYSRIKWWSKPCGLFSRILKFCLFLSTACKRVLWGTF